MYLGQCGRTYGKQEIQKTLTIDFNMYKRKASIENSVDAFAMNVICLVGCIYTKKGQQLYIYLIIKGTIYYV